MEDEFMARDGWNMKFPAQALIFDLYGPDSELY